MTLYLYLQRSTGDTCTDGLLWFTYVYGALGTVYFENEHVLLERISTVRILTRRNSYDTQLP